MKRLISVLLAVSMIISLVACGNQKADKYCTSCGSGMAKSDSFCPECGAAVGGTVTSSSANDADEKTTATTTTTTTAEAATTTTVTQGKPSTAKPTTTATKAKVTTTTAKPTTTAVKPTTAPTATMPTTPTTTTHRHTYSKYVCTGCGEIDKAHTYEYLLEWTLRNGKADGTHVSYRYFGNDKLYALDYNAQDDSLSVNVVTQRNGGNFYSGLYLNNYSYFVSLDDLELFGYLSPDTFTRESPISYEYYAGDKSNQYNFIELSRLSVNEMLEWLGWMLAVENVGIDLSDLGFLSYQVP